MIGLMGEVRRSLVVLLAFCGMIADGHLHSANTQCAPGAQIFIDPRLVPLRPIVSREQMGRALGLAPNTEGTRRLLEDKTIQYQFHFKRVRSSYTRIIRVFNSTLARTEGRCCGAANIGSLRNASYVR
jgi:hypothetical protein